MDIAKGLSIREHMCYASTLTQRLLNKKMENITYRPASLTPVKIGAYKVPY